MKRNNFRRRQIEKSGYFNSLSPAAQASEIPADISKLSNSYHLGYWSASARAELAPHISIKVETRDPQTSTNVDVIMQKLALMAASPAFARYMEEDSESTRAGFIHEDTDLEASPNSTAMNDEVAVRAAEGSEAAQSALAALAYTLNINEDILEIALNGAFDMMQVANGNPTLALQLSFSRTDYRIDHGTLFEIISTFRQAFGSTLGLKNDRATTAHVPTCQYPGLGWMYSGPANTASYNNVQPVGGHLMGLSRYPTSAFYTSPGPLNGRVSSSQWSPQYTQALRQPNYVGHPGTAFTGHARQATPQAGPANPISGYYPHYGTPVEGKQSLGRGPGNANHRQYC
ncbi:hypothetical protein DDE83_000613 [Stemphylium lycopersici]|uniref:Uncharacterized protein n=1 Tax=Stemphylium lycopersici TaxID=183478 RepID=A0A364NFF3_STELY|nr:hypothetical protein DDE83_000613 [Stemphylium lycopersici]